MTWTDPVRYPNALEQADPEGALNTYVIDNLAYLNANSGGIKVAKAGSQNPIGSDVGTWDSQISSNPDIVLNALRPVVMQYNPDNIVSISDPLSGTFEVAESGVYTVGFRCAIEMQTTNKQFTLTTKIPGGSFSQVSPDQRTWNWGGGSGSGQHAFAYSVFVANMVADTEFKIIATNNQPDTPATLKEINYMISKIS
jgi:hypothetical protein